MNIFQLVWLNSFRNKSRFILTCLSVMVAFYLFSILVGINHALIANVNSINEYRLMTNHKVSITQSLPVNYQQKILSISGVNNVSYASWFGGFFKDEKNQLAVIAVDHQSYFNLYREYEIPIEQLENWKKTRTGLVVGQFIANKYGWKVGDKIPLTSSVWMNKSGSFNWEFTVSAIYKTSDNANNEKKLFFQHDYFDKGRAYSRYFASWLITGIEKNTNVDSVIQAIDMQFVNASAPTRTTTEQIFIKEQAQQFVDMAMVIKIVVVAVFFTLLLIVCNTMAQVNRERLNESAMMKALGFSSLFLIIQVYLESLWLISLGSLLGCIFAKISLIYVSALFADFLPGIAIGPSHYLTITFLALLTAGLCVFFPAISIKRLNISSTLGAKT
ncbi:MAG: hypothetical protein OCD00_11540 [Colwellia sp.]